MVTVLMASFFPLFFYAQTVMASSGFEEQRKYNLPNTQQMSEKEFSIEYFQFFPHSVYQTYDIYFDSPEQVIKTNNLSLRLRRVEKTKNHYEYSVQLKSEMLQPGEIRTELEYKDLSSQTISQEKLTDLIDQFIAEPSKRSRVGFLLNQWMARKKTSSLSPFQKLRLLNVDASQVTPVVIGYSKRQRFHIYTNLKRASAEKIRLKNSTKNSFYLPAFFKKEKGAVWLMEASFDQSLFLDLKPPDLQSSPSRELNLVELELENKYRPRKRGTQLLNELESLIIDRWQAKKGMASKYLQAISYFSMKSESK